MEHILGNTLIADYTEEFKKYIHGYKGAGKNKEIVLSDPKNNKSMMVSVPASLVKLMMKALKNTEYKMYEGYDNFLVGNELKNTEQHYEYINKR